MPCQPCKKRYGVYAVLSDSWPADEKIILRYSLFVREKIMAQYIDGFVIPIARDKVEAYQHIAARAGAIWKEHGALAYWEGVGEDMDIEEMVAFPAMANAQDGETVIFAWIAYE